MKTARRMKTVRRMKTCAQMKLSDEKSHSPEPPATKLENLVHFTTFAKIVEIKHRLLQILRLRAPYNINYTTHKKFFTKIWSKTK